MTNTISHKFGGFDWESNVADGASAKAFTMRTATTFSTSGSSILRLNNVSTKIFEFSWNGGILFLNSGASSAPARNAVNLNWLATTTKAATGSRAWVTGQNNTASSAGDSFCHGDSNLNQGTNGVAIGGYNDISSSASHATALGNSNNSWRNYSVALGRHARAWTHNTVALSGQQFAVGGDAQSMWTTLKASTTGNTPTVMLLQNSGKMLMNMLDASWAFKAYIIARSNEADGNRSMAWKLTGLIHRDELGTTAFVGTPVKTVIADGASGAWDVSAVADDTDNELELTVTGATSTTIRWVALLKLTQVLHA
jgi:hypothetical protein